MMFALFSTGCGDVAGDAGGSESGGAGGVASSSSGGTGAAGATGGNAGMGGAGGSVVGSGGSVGGAGGNAGSGGATGPCNRVELPEPAECVVGLDAPVATGGVIPDGLYHLTQIGHTTCGPAEYPRLAARILATGANTYLLEMATDVLDPTKEHQNVLWTTSGATVTATSACGERGQGSFEYSVDEENGTPIIVQQDSSSSGTLSVLRWTRIDD